MILIDYSQLIIAGALTFTTDFDKGKNAEKQIDILRHTVLNTLLGDKRKYGKEYGEFVIAVDGRNYWRREVFAPYKAHRKKNREESKTDWSAIFGIADQLRQEFKEVFPYRFVEYDRAEADDIIAVLTKYTQTDELVVDGLFEDEPQRVLIKSSDGDFGQLHRWDNVRQWNPMQKKFVKKYGQNDLLEKLLTGDTGDGIPNIRSTDTQLIEGIRQPPITAKIKADAIEQFTKNGTIDFGNEFMNRNFQRNRMLIDFDYIPKDIYTTIVNNYKAAVPVHDKSKIFNYFVKHRCKQLIEHIQDF